MSKSWIDDDYIGQTTPVSKGQRLVIIYAGSDTGLILNVLIMWRPSVSARNYPNQINWHNYKKWLEEKLIPNLKSNSILVLDNTSYHCSLDERRPTSNFRKADMIAWLHNNNIPYIADMLKPFLYKLINHHKLESLRYLVDNLMR